MKNKIPIKMALCIIVLAVATVVIINQMNENNRLREKLDSVKHVLPFSQIQYDLVQLEGAIAYQMQAQWKEPAHVREKVGDVMQDIMVLMEVNAAIDMMSQQEKQDIQYFYNRILDYPRDNLVEPSNEISAAEQKELIHLREALKDAGWGIGLGNQAHWDSFIEKLRVLLPQL